MNELDDVTGGGGSEELEDGLGSGVLDVVVGGGGASVGGSNDVVSGTLEDVEDVEGASKVLDVLDGTSKTDDGVSAGVEVDDDSEDTELVKIDEIEVTAGTKTLLSDVVDTDDEVDTAEELICLLDKCMLLRQPKHSRCSG